MNYKIKINNSYLRIGVNFLMIFLVFFIHLTIIRVFDSWLGYLNLALIALIFVLELNGFFWTLFWVLGLGFLFEIFYFLPFGFFFLTLFLIVLVLYFLLSSFFTNRSLYSYLGLIFVATVLYEFVLNFLIYFLEYYSHQGSFFLFLKSFWVKLGQGLLVNFIIVFFLFYILNFLDKRFNALFIKSKY